MSWMMSSGVSSTILISWRTTDFSRSSSSALNSGCSRMSVSRSTASGRCSLRYASITLRLSVPRRVRRRRVLQLLLVGQRRLIAQRHLPAQSHFAIAVDLDDLDEHFVAFGQDVLDRADAVLRDLRDVQEPFGVGNDLDEGAELDDLLDLAQIDTIQLDLAADVLDDSEGLLDGRVIG